MQAILYIQLSTSPIPAIVYKRPLLEQLKSAAPGAAILDVDAQSDELMQHYALRLLRESQQIIVCIQPEDQTAELGSMMPLLEELLQPNPQRLILLLGEHHRLQRIFGARPELVFKVVGEGEVVGEVKGFLR